MAVPLFQLATPPFSQPLPGIFAIIWATHVYQPDTDQANGNETTYIAESDSNPQGWNADLGTVANWSAETLHELFSPSTSSTQAGISMDVNHILYWNVPTPSTTSVGLETVNQYAQSGASGAYPPPELIWDIVNPGGSGPVTVDSIVSITYTPVTALAASNLMGTISDPANPFDSFGASGTGIAFTSKAAGVTIAGPTWGTNGEPTALVISTPLANPFPGGPEVEFTYFNDFFDEEGMDGSGQSTAYFTYRNVTSLTQEKIRYGVGLSTYISTSTYSTGGMTELTFHFEEEVS